MGLTVFIVLSSLGLLAGDCWQRGGQKQILGMLAVGESPAAWNSLWVFPASPVADSLSLPAAEMCLEGKFKPLIPVWFSNGGPGAGGRTADGAGNEIGGHPAPAFPRGSLRGFLSRQRPGLSRGDGPIWYTQLLNSENLIFWSSVRA